MRRLFSRAYNDQPHFLSKVFCHLTASVRPTPDFLLIGAEKCGTETLYSQLIQHPQILLPLYYSIHYFDEAYFKSDLWYRAHFPLRTRCFNDLISGEKTTFYFGHPHVPARIHSIKPDIKMLLLLRNPIDRAISQYFHYFNRGLESLPLMEALKEEETRLAPYLNNLDEQAVFESGHPLKVYSYKYRGCYADHLKSYYKYFASSQIKVIKSEKYFANPAGILQEIFEFLGVASEVTIADLKPRNIGSRSKAVDPAVYSYLQAYFKSRNKQLAALLGEEFTW